MVGVGLLVGVDLVNWIVDASICGWTVSVRSLFDAAVTHVGWPCWGWPGWVVVVSESL